MASTVTGYGSVDGVNWTQVGTPQPVTSAAIYVGMAVSSNTTQTISVVFDNVSITVGATGPRTEYIRLGGRVIAIERTNP